MYTRHEEQPPYERRASTVEARFYNAVCLLWKAPRGRMSVRFDLPGLKTLDMIIQEDSWIIVDEAFFDAPVAAWSEFRVAGRDSLHLPVPCTLRLYHSHAEMVLERALEAMVEHLDSLDGPADERDASILPFRR